MLLLRHGSAGERLSTPSLDVLRPLDRAGRLQAGRLRTSLTGYRIEHIVSSPRSRCVKTVEPLADELGLAVEALAELEPEVARVDLLRALRELPPATLACTHREVFETLFGDRLRCEKGGAWVVERRAGRWRPTAYLPPPEALSRTAATRSATPAR